MNKRSFLLISILTIFIYQNCAPFESINGGDFNFASGGVAEFPQVKAILDAKCLTCHSTATAQNRNVSLATYQSILDSDIILGGNAQDSLLYISVANGSMPQGLPALSLSETEAIRTWINSGAPSDSGDVANQLPVITMPPDITVQLPATNIEIMADVRDVDGEVLRTQWSQRDGPNTANFIGDRTPTLIVNNVQEGTYIFELLVEDDFGAIITSTINLTVNAAPPPPTPTVSFTNDVNPILQASCVSCHGGATPSADFSVESYNQVITRINAGNLTGSELYIRINGGTMPPNGQTPLDAAQINTILTWIQEGAPNN